MKIVKKGDVTVLKFELFENMEFLDHCFTSKLGGNSKGSFSSLNMGMNTEDDEETVKSNYEKVGKDVFKAEVGDFVLSKQVHKTDIAVVSAEDRGNGITKEQKYGEIDGLATDVAGPILSTVYADCTPLFFADEKKRVVGVAHAGWKGTVGKIGKNMIELMSSEFGSDPKDIVVGIGPTIGPCCYKVREDVAEQFREGFSDCSRILRSVGDGQFIVDLWEANKTVVKEAGVLECNIETDSHCTNCNSELLYSYRRDNGKTGRMAAMIKIKY